MEGEEASGLKYSIALMFVRVNYSLRCQERNGTQLREASKQSKLTHFITFPRNGFTSAFIRRSDTGKELIGDAKDKLNLRLRPIGSPLR